MPNPELTVSSSPTARQTPYDGVTRSRQSPQSGLAVGAATVTILLTSAAFWLSYAHLESVAASHGLSDAARAWTWPATVDLFIVAGELLILRASLLQNGVDWWAVALAATGSLGSIALNVAGVGTNAQPLAYVVAGTPPIAALLAFGALMRQVHQALMARQHVVTPLPMPVTAPQPATQESLKQEVEETVPDVVDVPVMTPPPEPVTEPQRPSAPPTQREQIDATVRKLYDTLGRCRPGTRHMKRALADAGLPSSDGTCREARKRVELAEPALRDLPDAIAA